MMRPVGVGFTSRGPIGVDGLTTTAGAERALVLYDGQCRLCRKSVALLRRLDWGRRLEFADARRAEGLPPGLEAARLLEEEVVFIPIAAPIRWSLVGTKLPGFTENIVGRHPLVGLGTAPSREGN